MSLNCHDPLQDALPDFVTEVDLASIRLGGSLSSLRPTILPAARA